jgi:hypothetical protein
MRATVIQFTLIAGFAGVAFGQPAKGGVDRSIGFAHVETVQALHEIGAVLVAITGVQPISTDEARKALSVRGTASQIALAVQLSAELDHPNIAAVHEYPFADGDENVVRVFYLDCAKTAQDLQEAATLVRSISGIRRLFTYGAAKAVVIRGTEVQATLADWFVTQLNRPGTEERKYEVPGGRDDIAGILYLSHTETIQQFQEIVTLIRAMGDIPRVFTFNASRAMALRGTREQMALAEWLVGELNLPIPQRPGGEHEYRMTGGGDPDGVVRVFYLAHAETPERLQEIAVQVRKQTEARRVFTYNALRAMALRGTDAQMSLAGQLIQEQDR